MNRSLRELFVQEFELCALRPGETVAVISELGAKQDYVAAAVDAARSLGAAALVLSTSSLSAPVLPPHEASVGRELAPLVTAAGECDLVIDVTVGGLVHSDVRTRITGAGKRMLFVAEPPDVLRRLMGNDELRRAVLNGVRMLEEGSVLRITSELGTDIVTDISGDALPITPQWGYTDEPGRWDHWPSGFVACFPHDQTARGTIVLQPGDAILPWLRYVRDAATITVEDGFITQIKGGADAFLLRDYLESWDDPNAWAISHMGWGLHPAARWSALELEDARRLFGQELRSTAGNFMWSTGSNRFAARDTPAHLDIPMRDCTVEIDGVAVVEHGHLTQ